MREDEDWEVEKEGGEAENRGMDHHFAVSRLFRAQEKKNSRYNLAGRANAWKPSFTLTFLSLSPFYFPLCRQHCVVLFTRETQDNTFCKYALIFVRNLK